jgi:hypothetical protein
MLLPLIDLVSCGIILWTILQTRKHLAAGASTDGKGIVELKLMTEFLLTN